MNIGHLSVASRDERFESEISGERQLTRNAQQHKLRDTCIVDRLEELEVPRNDGLDLLGVVGEPERVADVIHANPDADDGVCGGPRCPFGLGISGDVLEEQVDLVTEAEDLGRVGGHEVSVRGSASVGEVECPNVARVVLGSHEADPIEPSTGSPSGGGRVAHRVRERRLLAIDVEAGLGVRVATRMRGSGQSVVIQTE